MYVHIGNGQIALVSNIVAVINLADATKKKNPRSQIVLINNERIDSDIGTATLSMRVKHSIDRGKRKMHGWGVTSRKRRCLSTYSRQRVGRIKYKK